MPNWKFKEKNTYKNLYEETKRSIHTQKGGQHLFVCFSVAQRSETLFVHLSVHFPTSLSLYCNLLIYLIHVQPNNLIMHPIDRGGGDDRHRVHLQRHRCARGRERPILGRIVGVRHLHLGETFETETAKRLWWLWWLWWVWLFWLHD